MLFYLANSLLRGRFCYNKIMPETDLYQCPECRLHYADEALAIDCEEFCRVHKACSLEIAQHSVESIQKI